MDVGNADKPWQRVDLTLRGQDSVDRQTGISKLALHTMAVIEAVTPAANARAT